MKGKESNERGGKNEERDEQQGRVWREGGWRVEPNTSVTPGWCWLPTASFHPWSPEGCLGQHSLLCPRILLHSSPGTRTIPSPTSSASLPPPPTTAPSQWPSPVPSPQALAHSSCPVLALQKEPDFTLVKQTRGPVEPGRQGYLCLV